MKTSPKEPVPPPPSQRAASPLTIRKRCRATPSSSRLERMRAAAWAAFSTKTASAAPRLRASIPREPLPAKMSATLVPPQSTPWDSSMEKRDSRTLPVAGR